MNYLDEIASEYHNLPMNDKFIEIINLIKSVFSAIASLFPVFINLAILSLLFSTVSKSFNWSSKSIISLSLIGSIDPILMLVFDGNENKYYRIHSDLVTEGILNKS